LPRKKTKGTKPSQWIVCCTLLEWCLSTIFSRSSVMKTSRSIWLSHGLWPWKYLRQGGAIPQWKICKWKLKTSATVHANRRERNDTNVTNDDVFWSVCSAYLTPILVVCADMTHSPWENLNTRSILLSQFHLLLI
jgi:hypothetical protein